MRDVYLKSKKQTTKATAVLIIILIIIGSIFYLYPQTEEKKQEKNEETIKKIDDRISPLENQGLIVEINRIRHRGLYEKLMKIGTEWRKKPTFYYIIKIDDLEYISKNVEAPGFSEEEFFNTWDTMLQENKIVKDAAEEQEKSEIKLRIIERVPKGIFGLRYEDIEKEQIQITYDYRTGRWEGDDNYKDFDGYGHYIGETFEIWFNVYQVDYDRDYIPYWTEVNILKTDPRMDDTTLDQDSDGVPTAWEWKWGYDPFIFDDHLNLDPDIDGLENHEEYKMRNWLSDPFSQDVYVEVDHMGKGGLFDPAHILWVECQQAIIEKYCQHNIKLYFDTGWPNGPVNGGGEVLDHIGSVSQDSGMILQFYNNHFPEERKGIFRYVIVGHRGNFNHPSKSNVYDSIFISYNFDLKTSITGALLNKVFTPRTKRISLASSLMHELGHSIGISPWSFEGCDNISYANGLNALKEYKEKWGENYYSVMNYYVMYNNDLLDYSDGSNGPPYDQNDWGVIFVPKFQMNNEIVEEIFFSPPVDPELIIWDETDFTLNSYNLESNLTEEFINNYVEDWSPVHPIEVDWRVYKLEDNIEKDSGRNIKIYVKPRVPFSTWVLFAEGEVSENLSFQIT